MARVTGIGGLFFKARDPEALSKWYEEMLGIPVLQPPWMQDAGPTVLSPMAQETDYFDRPGQQWMMNLRVDDLEGIMADLRAKGVEVITDPDWNSAVGRFARIHDPEGNPIELWEPGSPPA